MQANQIKKSSEYIQQLGCGQVKCKNLKEAMSDEDSECFSGVSSEHFTAGQNSDIKDFVNEGEEPRPAEEKAKFAYKRVVPTKKIVKETYDLLKAEGNLQVFLRKNNRGLNPSQVRSRVLSFALGIFDDRGGIIKDRVLKELVRRGTVNRDTIWEGLIKPKDNDKRAEFEDFVIKVIRNQLKWITKNIGEVILLDDLKKQVSSDLWIGGSPDAFIRRRVDGVLCPVEFKASGCWEAQDQGFVQLNIYCHCMEVPVSEGLLVTFGEEKTEWIKADRVLFEYSMTIAKRVHEMKKLNIECRMFREGLSYQSVEENPISHEFLAQNCLHIDKKRVSKEETYSHYVSRYFDMINTVCLTVNRDELIPKDWIGQPKDEEKERIIGKNMTQSFTPIRGVQKLLNMRKDIGVALGNPKARDFGHKLDFSERNEWKWNFMFSAYIRGLSFLVICKSDEDAFHESIKFKEFVKRMKGEYPNDIGLIEDGHCETDWSLNNIRVRFSYSYKVKQFILPYDDAYHFDYVMTDLEDGRDDQKLCYLKEMTKKVILQKWSKFFIFANTFESLKHPYPWI